MSFFAKNTPLLPKVSGRLARTLLLPPAIFKESRVTDAYAKMHLDKKSERKTSDDLYGYQFFENIMPTLPLLGFKLHTKKEPDGATFLVEPVFKVLLLSEILKTLKKTGPGLTLSAAEVKDRESLKQSLLPYFESAGLTTRVANALSDRMITRVESVKKTLEDDLPTLD
jgi:hypothetical protein